MDKIGKHLTVERARHLISSNWPYEMKKVLRTPGEENEVELIKGAIDIHVHDHSPGPPILAKGYDVFEICKSASRLGMKALIFKNMLVETANMASATQKLLDAWASSEALTPVQVFGSAVLNRSVGGLNTEFVNAMVSFPRMKAIWMPTLHSAHHVEQAGGDKSSGITATTKDGVLRSELVEIVRTVSKAKNKMFISSGHLYPFEITKLCEEC